MQITGRKCLQDFLQQNPAAAKPLQKWYTLFLEGKWKSLQEVRQVFRHADMVPAASGKTLTIFNIGGNKYRLIGEIHFGRQHVHVLRVLKHDEYTKGFWKKWF